MSPAVLTYFIHTSAKTRTTASAIVSLGEAEAKMMAIIETMNTIGMTDRVTLQVRGGQGLV